MVIDVDSYYADPRQRMFADRVLARLGLDDHYVVEMELPDEGAAIITRLMRDRSRGGSFVMVEWDGGATLLRIRQRYDIGGAA